MHLMVAVDESRYAATIIKWMKRFPHPVGTRMTLVHIVEPLDLPESMTVGDRQALNRARQNDVRRLLERATVSLQDTYPKLEVKLQEGLPTYEILRLLHDEHPDVIVAGFRGLLGGKGFTLGSVAQRLLHYAPCSVLLIPSKATPKKTLRVRLATDGSPGSQDAARFLTILPRLKDLGVITVIRPVGAREIALYANGRRTSARALRANLVQARREAGERALDITMETLRPLGITIKSVIEAGRPADTIARVAQRQGCDLLVLGSRGLTGQTAIAMGSISLSVAQQATCPVLIVKPRG